MAPTMLSMTALRRPSEKLATHSISALKALSRLCLGHLVLESNNKMDYSALP